jgi:polyisoprenyl-teichoic acid--peptidoglycan teichoic acid transferase
MPYPGARGRTRAKRSPSVAAFLSTLWPGLGQLYVGKRRTATFFAVPVLVVVLLAAHELLQGLVVLALGMLSPTYALIVLIVIALDGAWRVASLLHAYALSVPRVRSRSRVDRGVVAALLIAVVMTHVVTGYYAWSAYAADVQIGQTGANTGDPGPVETPDPSGAPVMSTPTPGPQGTQHPSPNPVSQDQRETVLFVGIDAAPGRQEALTDSMLVVSLDADTKQVAMISVPRDTTMFQLYWNHATLGPTFKLNELTTAIRSKWFPAPDDPMTALKKEIGFIVGIPVDYYVSLDLPGFQTMIDVVGGVDVANLEAFYDPLQQRAWPAGAIHLDGANALLYVRSRYGDNDYMRASRQQDVMVALEKKLSTPAMLVKLPTFLSAAGKAIHTDYPLDRVKDRAVFARSLESNAISRCVLGPPYSSHPDTSTTSGVWTSRLDMDLVASLSVEMFGQSSSYYGSAQPAPCPAS